MWLIRLRISHMIALMQCTIMKLSTINSMVIQEPLIIRMALHQAVHTHALVHIAHIILIIHGVLIILSAYTCHPSLIVQAETQITTPTIT